MSSAVAELHHYLQTSIKNNHGTTVEIGSPSALESLQQLRTSNDPSFLFIRSLMELFAQSSGQNGNVSMDPGKREQFLFHCSLGVRDTTLMNFGSVYPIHYCRMVRDFLLHVGLMLGGNSGAILSLQNGANSQLPLPYSNVVAMSCLGGAAALWKRDGWGASSAAVGHANANCDALMIILKAAAPNLTVFHEHSSCGQLFSFLESLILRPIQNSNSSWMEQQHSKMACHFLSCLIGELGGGLASGASVNTAARYNLPMEFHRLASLCFEKSSSQTPTNSPSKQLHLQSAGLDDVLRIAMTALNGIVSNWSHVTPIAQSVISLTIDVLSWEFGLRAWDTRGTSIVQASISSLLRPPNRWSVYLIRPDFLGAVFGMYAQVRELAVGTKESQPQQPHQPLSHQHQQQQAGLLAHGLRQLLLQLSSVSGTIFATTTTGAEPATIRLEYARFLVEGCLELYATICSSAKPPPNQKTTTTNTSYEISYFHEREMVDICIMICRLIANFKVTELSQLTGTFDRMLTMISTIGNNDLLTKMLSECERCHGDVDMVEGIEWREEALDCLLEGIVLLSDDHWILSESGKSAAQSLSMYLAPLYGSYICCRVNMAKLEERCICESAESTPSSAADLDALREDISAFYLEEQMTAASSLGRLNVRASLQGLSALLNDCLPKLRAFFDGGAVGAGVGAVVSPDGAALLEEARLLVISVCHFLTDDDCSGETPLIPESIVGACGDDLRQVLMDVVSPLLSLAEFQAEKVASNANDPRLSPLLAKTLLWFIRRWASSYILPDALDYSCAPQCLVGIMDAWSKPDTAQSAISFCTRLCLLYHCYWPLEPEVQESASSLLRSLAGGSTTHSEKKRSALINSPSFEHLAVLHTVTAGISHEMSNTELETMICSNANIGTQNLPKPTFYGYKRLPYVDRARVLTGLLIGSSGGNDAKSQAIFNSCLGALSTAFSSLCQALSNKRVSSTDIKAKEMASLCVELYGGVARASDMCAEPQRIPEFLTPSLGHLSGLMFFYAQELSICESILRFFRDYAERCIISLNNEQSVTLFSASSDLLREYSSFHCSEKRLIPSQSTFQSNAEEEQTFSDVLCAIQLLVHLGTKDFIDECDNGVDSNQITDVVLYGLQQILPLMSQGLLQFPKLCTNFFSLVGFTMDTYSAKVCTLPYNLFSALLDSLLFGMSHTDLFVAKSSLAGISSLAWEHINSKSPLPYLASSTATNHHYHCSTNGNINDNLIDKCTSRLMKEVILQPIIWDRLEAASMALLPLIVLDMQRFAALANGIVAQQDPEKVARMQASLSKLIDPTVVGMMSGNTMGLDGRKNRIKFKNSCEVFVKDLHSFMLIV